MMYIPVMKTATVCACLFCGPTFAASQISPDADLPTLQDNTLTLTAEQSFGGVLQHNKDGSQAGVTLNRSCEANFAKPSEACIEWKLADPLPAGWWRGTLHSNAGNGWANREFRVMFMSGRNPDVMIKPNYNGNTPDRFDFRIYTSEPTSAIRLTPKGDLWRSRETWAINRITLTRETPSAFTGNDAMTLDLPVEPDGTLVLPAALPAGAFSMTGVMNKDAEIFFSSQDGRTGSFAFAKDRWKRPRSAFFYVDSPLRGIRITPSDAFIDSVLLRHDRQIPYVSTATATPLLTTVDDQRIEEGTLELYGKELTGGAPQFTTYPHGRKIAVLTSWDDGKSEDLRTAEILNRQGFRPTFFLNKGSPARKFADKLIALNGEIGSHSVSHPSLNALSPEDAYDECAEMRKELEQQLGHPVISFAYPNGYSPAYDLEGDYVLRAVKQAGYWSIRGTAGQMEVMDALKDRPVFISFVGNRKELVENWAKLKDREGAIFYFWGHSWQLNKSEEGWADFEKFVSHFANEPEAWYATQGELSLWFWSRKHVNISASTPEAERRVVTLSRPWLHPWLSDRNLLSLQLPEGVERAEWQGKELQIKDGIVNFLW